MLGYDLKTAVNANKLVANNNGSRRRRTLNGITYNTDAFSWKAQTNSARKCSNISVKKYQNKPMFGFKSRTFNLKHWCKNL